MVRKAKSIFKYEVCYKSNINGQRLCMPERTRTDAVKSVRNLKLDNKVHQNAGDIALWKDIKIRPKR